MIIDLRTLTCSYLYTLSLTRPNGCLPVKNVSLIFESHVVDLMEVKVSRAKE